MFTTTLAYPNGDSYTGQFSTNLAGVPVPHGYGTMTRVNGETHTGYYYEGRRHGQGQSYSTITQRHYNGGYVNDQEEGFATITRPGTYGGQRQYSGQVANNMRHGRGMQVETSTSGSIITFDGQWVNDQLVGQGSFKVTESGCTHTYEGTFVAGKLEGWGTYYNSWGVRYRAFFQAGSVIQWSV